jgi:hypothetical protein
MGSVVVVWAVLRIVRPLPEHGLFDGVARTLFAAWQAYALAHGASRLLWLFLAVEVAFGVLQLAPWRRSGNTDLVDNGRFPSGGSSDQARGPWSPS